MPHCPLSVVKTLIDAGKVRTTRSAREGAATMAGVAYIKLTVVDDLLIVSFKEL